MTTSTAMVFVIDDDPSMRKSLQRLLDAARVPSGTLQVRFRVSLAFNPSGTFVRGR